MVPAVVVVLAVVLAFGALITAARPSAPGDGVADHLPPSPTTRMRADIAGGGTWQVNQGVLPAASAWSELSLLARRQLEPPAVGHWLTIDVISPDPDTGRTSLDLEVVGETVSLRVVTTTDRSLVLDPGIPVLTPDLLDGGSVAWVGGLAVDDQDVRPAEAEVTTGPAPDRPGCVETSLVLDGTREVLTWCSGADAGIAGWRTETGGRLTGFTPDPAPLPDRGPDPFGLDDVPTAQLTGEEVLAIGFFRIVSGSYREQRAPEGSRAVWAADQLVVADTSGRLTSWLHVPEQQEESIYTQVWRAQPGGSVRGIDAVGAVTYVGTTTREVVAYDRDGWQLWRRTLPDAVTQLHGTGTAVVVTDASGGLHALDPLTGETLWQTSGVTQVLDVGSDAGVVVAVDGTRMRVLDLRTGAQRWSARIATAEATAAVLDHQVAVIDGNWLTVHDPSGGVDWLRAVPTDTLLLTTGGALVISERQTARIVDQAGDEVWRSSLDMPIVVPGAHGGELLGVQEDRLVREGVGLEPLIWDYPDGTGPPELAPLHGDQGVVTLQFLGGEYRWWEYR